MRTAIEYLHRLLRVWKKIKSLRMADSYKAMQPCDVIVCCSDGDRTEDYDGLAYSRIADSLSEALAERGLAVQSLAWPYSLLVGQRSWGNAYSANRFFFFDALRHRSCQLLGLKDIGEAWTIDFYSKLFIQTGARTVVGIGLPPAAIKAAKLNHIKSIEILHGYGYTSLPYGWNSKPSQDLPDVVLAFDDLSVETFGVLTERGVRVVRIRNLWYEKFRDNSIPRRLPDSWRSPQDWIPRDKKIVLVSLSWGYDNDHGVYAYFAGILKNGLFPDELKEAMQMAGDDYYWIFRLHPVQVQSERAKHYKKMLDDLCSRYGNCEWVMGTKMPLPVLLQRCHAHITMISMTAYDAAFMGVRTLLLCPTLRPGEANELMFSDLRRQGYAELGSLDSIDIVRWLCLNNRPEKPFVSQLNSELLDPVSVVM